MKTNHPKRAKVVPKESRVTKRLRGIDPNQSTTLSSPPCRLGDPDDTDTSSSDNQSDEVVDHVDMDPVLVALLDEFDQIQAGREASLQETQRLRQQVRDQEDMVVAMLMAGKPPGIIQHGSVEKELAQLDELKRLEKESDTWSEWFHKSRAKQKEIISRTNEWLRNKPGEPGDYAGPCHEPFDLL